MKKLLPIIIIALSLSGCTDSVKEAKAGAIRRESEAQYLATATAVTLQAWAAEVQIVATATAEAQAISAQATEQADKLLLLEQTHDERLQHQEVLIYTGMILLGILGIAVTIALSIAGIGTGKAVATQTQLRARLVRLDPQTGTWPILVDLEEKTITDLETGAQRIIGEKALPHPGQLALSGQARTAGIGARAAVDVAKATKNAGPADWLPQLVSGVPLLTGEIGEEDGPST